MIAFLDGWRRKVGCITLVLAMVSLGGWAKSFGVRNHLNLQRGLDGRNCHQIASSRGYLEWTWVEPDSQKRLPPFIFTRYGYGLLNIVNNDGQRTISRNWTCCGIECGECRSKNLDRIVSLNPADSFGEFRFSIARISYWYVISPLTLLSAYLLLSKRPPMISPSRQVSDK